MTRVLTLGGVADSTSAQSSLLREPSTSLALQKATNQNHAQKFPISLSVLKPPAQTGLNPSGRFSCRFRSHHPLAAALSFRIWGALLSASRQWLRKPWAVLRGVVVGPREAHVPREWLLHTSFREAEVPPLLLQTTRLLFSYSRLSSFSPLSACPQLSNTNMLLVF